MNLVLVATTTNAEAFISFSVLKSLKTNIRSTRGNNWTNYLMIFAVHQEEIVIFVLILCSIASKTSNKTEVKCYFVELLNLLMK